MNTHNFTPGQILFYEYCCSSVFPVFYQVIKVSPKSIVIQEIAKNYKNVAPGFGSFDCVPDPARKEGRERRVMIDADGSARIRYYSYSFELRPYKNTPVSGFSA